MSRVFLEFSGESVVLAGIFRCLECLGVWSF